MKCLSLTAPYGTLIALAEKHPELGKHIETRSWSTSYRGPLAIHQAKGPGDFRNFKAILDLCGTQPFFDSLMHIVPNYDVYCDRNAIFERLPLGAIVATCELVDCVPAWPDWASVEPHFIGERGDQVWHVPPAEPEWSFGNYSPGRFAWLLADIRALPEPIPCKGALGLWNYEGVL
jgi:activating signal cointegrator 1